MVSIKKVEEKWRGKEEKKEEKKEGKKEKSKNLKITIKIKIKIMVEMEKKGETWILKIFFFKLMAVQVGGCRKKEKEKKKKKKKKKKKLVPLFLFLFLFFCNPQFFSFSFSPLLLAPIHIRHGEAHILLCPSLPALSLTSGSSF